jgi:tetratricopeptide (TPR) repeat protein
MVAVFGVVPAFAQPAPPPVPQSDALSVHELVVLGDRENAARRPALALPYYEKAIALDSNSYVSLWKASRELVDLGEAADDEARSREYYRRATLLAKRAVVVSPHDAEGHFHLSRAIGRMALSVSARDRVKYALDVRTEALKALEYDPRHPGALHIMGVWNAEVMRLNGVLKYIAKKFMGGAVLDSASWAEATRLLELSVAIDPDRLVHRLDLARIYRDSGRKKDARAAYQAALASKLIDANDDMYRNDAARELAALGR